MERQPLHIVSVGECTIDDYLDLRKEFIGGISFNFAVHCKRTGAESVSLISRIGKDGEERFLSKLSREDVGVSHLRVLPGSTARQNITLTAEGERVFPLGGYDPGVLQDFSLEQADIEFLQQHNLVASALYDQIEPLFRQVMALPFQGWRVADFLDLSDYGHDTGLIEQFSEKLNIAFVSGDEDLVERLRPVSAATRCLIVITLGAKGSVALEKGEAVFQPAISVQNPVDSTGCGDAFQAAFTVSYWDDADLQRALEAGAQQAAQVLQHFGTTSE